MRKFDLRALQICELDVLKEFVRVCEKNHLTYYLAWGSLIGAVRHQGFIPWDDDIDVCMPYEDYVRFKDVCMTDLHEDFFYEDWYAHPDYFLFWGKLRKNKTTCMTRSESNLKIHWGVGIDIFPLVKMDDRKCPFSKRAALAMMDFIVKRSYLPYAPDGLSKNIKRILYKLLPKKMEKHLFEKCFDILTQSTEDAAYLWDISAPIKRSCWPAEVFGKGEKYLFEDCMFNCPADADKYLKQAYGDDYMVIPKVEDRVDHGDIIVDLEKDYSYYQPR